MSTLENEQAGKTDTGSQVSSVIKVDTIDGAMVGVQLDTVREGMQVSSVAEVGTVSGSLIGIRIGSLGDKPADSLPAAEKPPTELVDLIARVRAWLARVL